jgi:6-phosphogluconolactonase
MATQPEIRICVTPQDLFHAAADEVVHAATQAVAARGRFTIALSGGSTPRSLYTLLADSARDFPWPQTFFFWGDERHVPPDNPESNYRMANESLLSKVPVPPANVFRVLAENPDAGAAASAYEQTIQSFFHLDAANPFPNFDLILLGIGPDGHTASLFPGTKALLEQSRLVVANLVDKLNTDRITLTYPVLNAAHCVLFLVSGLDKAPALQEVLEGTGAVETYPAKGVRPEEGRLVWIADRAAASMLQRTGKSEG